jgi:hypothetical protein
MSPQRRPARTLVLIFMVGSYESGRGRELAALATGTNLGLDLHGGLHVGKAAAAVAAGTNLGLDLHGGLLDAGKCVALATGTNFGLDLHGGS